MSQSAGSEGASGPWKGLGVQKGFLLAVVVGMTVLFLVMVRGFLVAVILAGVFAGMARPAFLALSARLGDRRRLASLLTVLGLALIVVVPLGAFLTLVVTQAVDLGDSVGPWIQERAHSWDRLATWLHALPIVGPLVPDEQAIAAWASQFAGRAGTFLINNVRAATTSTMGVVLQLFVALYALYFFLLDGPAILGRILYFTPLQEGDERRLVAQFESVTRATIKGSIIVGLIQGALAGSAFFILRLPGAAFWSTVMAVLSVIPVLGSGIVWAPAAVILVATGRVGGGIFLAIWGLFVVGLVDNFLRPRFVGRDTKMHDLLVLLSTFGGLAMFGLVGFIIGPIIAALFVTAWDLYGAAFRSVLPPAPEWSRKDERTDADAESDPQDRGEPAEGAPPPDARPERAASGGA